MNRLIDCTCTAQTDSADEFVGIRKGKLDSVKIFFPAGYFQNDDEIKNYPEDKLRESVLNLFAVLSDSSLSDKNFQSAISRFPDDNSEVQFPMSAYLNVLRNYLDFGYYTEKEILFKRGAQGKINWGRTIKTTRPILSEDEQNVLYLKPVARYTHHNESELITQIHKFCVHDVSKRIGFIFGVEIQQEPTLDFDYNLFQSVLQAKISRTFNDRLLHLFGDLQRIVEYIANKLTIDASKADDFYFGVNKFAPIWEAMLDRIFGNINPNESKADFNPHTFWQFENGSIKDANKYSNMRPDTIMRQTNSDGIDEIFVLDAKFYSYGIANGTLPDSGSITKQIAYAEYIEANKDNGKKFDVEAQHIYNAFLLPYRAKEIPDAEPYRIKPYRMKFFGIARSDWKSDKPFSKFYRPYHQIVGIFLDVESVMKNYNQSKVAQSELAELIRTKASQNCSQINVYALKFTG